MLDAAGVRFRTGKCLLPFRITGNIDWGVPAPELDGTSGLTVWCWPESLWAPISFTQTALDLDAQAGGGRYSSDDWRDWWCGRDSRVYQFIGQDNIYFYCVAQPALWDALGWNLFQDTPIANYHILFMNKKASSSGAIKPPMAAELLDHYTPEQLRAHWLSLGLDQKAVSFNPKPFDTSVSHKDKKTGEEVLVKDDPRIVDPALKESAFLTNIFNRLARSCFYGAANVCDAHLPAAAPHPEVVEACRKATLDFEVAAHAFDAHGALSVAEEFCRQENKRWDDASKAAKGDDAAYEQALADAFRALRTVTLLMHRAHGLLAQGVLQLGARVRRPYGAGRAPGAVRGRSRNRAAAAAIRLLREAPHAGEEEVAPHTSPSPAGRSDHMTGPPSLRRRSCRSPRRPSTSRAPTRGRTPTSPAASTCHARTGR